MNRTYQGVDHNITAEVWKAIPLLVGVQGNFHLKSDGKLKFTPRVELGLLNLTVPGLTGVGKVRGFTSNLVQTGTSTSSFAYLLGAGVQYPLGENFKVSLNIDYLGSNPSYSVTRTGFDSNNPTTVTVNQSYAVINASIGIAYSLF